MTFIDVTFERGATLIKTVAKISAGWDGRKSKFYGQQFADFKNDIQLSVKVWLTASTVVREFPMDFNAKCDAGSIKREFANGRLTVSALLKEDLSWVRTDNGKPAVDWLYNQPVPDNPMLFHVRHMIIFN